MPEQLLDSTTDIAAYIPPRDPLVREALDKWQDRKLGMIIHWGPYSQWGVVESWSLCGEDEGWCERRGPYAHDYALYKQRYEALPATFRPTRFNPEGWARAASQAGMKYAVFTTKHHDGFCMYDTRQTTYKVTDPACAFSADPRADLTRHVFDAFRAEGLTAGAYFSKPDWHSDDFWWRRFPAADRHANYDLTRYPERWQRFKEFTYRQIEELVTRYGELEMLWLDGGWVRPGRRGQDVDMERIAAMAREHQPGLIVVDRAVRGPFQDYLTPEHEYPDEPLPYPWESCIPLGPSWYAASPDERYKSVTEVVHMLVRIVSRGGNLLLGIGPDATGEFVPEVYERLAGLGTFLDANGEAIYGTRPVAPYQRDEVYFTRSKDGRTTYAIGLLPANSDTLPAEIGLPRQLGEPRRVRLLGGARSAGSAADATWTVDDDTITVSLPTGRGEHAFCIALEH
ncbi:alpha-L-fucosidase [Flindersiella endophytica]